MRSLSFLFAVVLFFASHWVIAQQDEFKTKSKPQTDTTTRKKGLLGGLIQTDVLDNIKNANLDEYISIEEKNFFDTEKTSQGKLHMVFNPPYDERLDIHMEEFYKNIGDTLKKNYPGTNA